MLNEKIVYYRKKNMLTQEELAYQLNVSRQTATKWETGTIYPNIEYLIKLSNLFGVSIDYLVKEDNYMNHEDFVKETMQLDYESINILKNIKNSNHSLRDFENYLLKLKEECSNVNY